MEFITENIKLIGAIVLAATVGGVALFSYNKSKSKKTTMKNIKTKSGDVVAGDKTTHK